MTPRTRLSDFAVKVTECRQHQASAQLVYEIPSLRPLDITLKPNDTLLDCMPVLE